MSFPCNGKNQLTYPRAFENIARKNVYQTLRVFFNDHFYSNEQISQIKNSANMSLETPKNQAERVLKFHTDSLKIHLEAGSEDDEHLSPHKLSSLQVTNAELTDPSIDVPPPDDHEYPCVCDLRLPRKALNSEERYRMAKDYLRKESKSQRRSPRRLAKTFSTSPQTGLKSKSPSSKRAQVKKNAEKEDSKTSKKIVGGGKKGLQGEGVASSAASPSAKSPTESETSPRKNITWNKQPKIAVKMNRTANMRLEKGTTLCGRKPIVVVPRQIIKREDVRKKRAGAGRKVQGSGAGKEEKMQRLTGKSEDGDVGSEVRAQDAVECEYMKCKRFQ